MAEYWTVEMLKLTKNLVPYERESYRKFVASLASDLENSDQMTEMMIKEVELTLFKDITLNELLETSVLVAAQNIQQNIDFDKLATRIVEMQIYTTALQFEDSDTEFSEVYKRSFKNYIKKAIDDRLLNPEMATIFDLDELANTLDYRRDDEYIYIGIDTALKRYMVKDRNKQEAMETPQFMWMRIGMGISLKEKNPNETAKTFYEHYSKLELIPGGSTNIGSGTTYSVLSNCYLIDTEDDINSIFDNVKHVALISKATGGIGISVTKLRAAGSPVRSNNTFSTGPIPFIKVMDAALKSVSRAGKKAGAMAVYMENWHVDFDDFLDLKQNAGDDYRRIRTADTAVYISDEFMKRVIKNEDWYMFDPLEVPELPELYGSDFSKKYNEYVEKAKRKELRMVKKLPAREQMKKILTSLQGNSHPWLTWKDTINVRALNNNTGTIHSSNLCTEVCLPQDKNNIAVCNLLYVNLARHIRFDATTPEDRIDWKKLGESVKVGMRHLDNLIDVNAIDHIKEAKHSDVSNRAVGLGIMGFSETLESFGYAYDSKEAYDLIDRVIEFVSYNTIDESCNLAIERGAYSNFKGSMWSKGYVPYDTIQKVAEDRAWDSPESLDPLAQGLESIRRKIQEGESKAADESTKELYELFNQLTNYITNNKLSKNVSSGNQNHSGEGITLTQNREIRMDWNKLRERVKKGVRNATTMMIAPNASTGLLAGTTPGVDPRFAQIFSRATSRGKFLDINPNLVKDLRRLGIWEEVRDQVLQKYGDISEIQEIPEELKAVYKTSFQISPYAFLEVASRAQKWIDQSISRNMYLETRDIEDMVKIYTDAWRRGVKTTYYLHVKPRHSAEQSTVKVNKGKDLNKAGFRTIAPAHVEEVVTTQQMALVKGETKEIKGFGFAKFNAPSPDVIQQATAVTLPVEEVKLQSQMKKQESKPISFGFGSVVNKTTSEVKEDKASFKDTKSKYTFDACPVDPMERAACESCQ